MILWRLLVFRRVRDKYESELKELEESERNMQEKYNNMKVSSNIVVVAVFRFSSSRSVGLCRPVLLSGIELRYCLITTSYLTGLLAIFILRHI